MPEDIEGGPELFTIWVRDVPFKLTRTQLQFDSPNWFTATFLEHDFVEAQSKIIYTDRNPQNFRLIVEYLSGYDILPLPECGGAGGVATKELVRKNLLKDADFFGLDKLHALLDDIPLPSILWDVFGVPKTDIRMEWDEFVDKNARGAYTNGIVILRDVQVVFKRQWFNDSSMLVATLEVDLPGALRMDSNSAPPNWVHTQSPGDNFIVIGENSRSEFSDSHLLYGLGSRFRDRPITLNGIVTNLDTFFRHEAFYADISSYVKEELDSSSPLKGIVMKVEVIDESQMNLRVCTRKTTLYAHEIHLIPFEVKDLVDSVRKKVLGMTFACCSTLDHLNEQMGHTVLSRLQPSK